MNRFQRFAANQPAGMREFYESVFQKWDEETLHRATEMASRLAAAGCDEPEGWISSEISEGIPQLARFALLKSIWENSLLPAIEAQFWLNGESKDRLSKIDQVLNAQEKKELFTDIAKSLCFGILNVLDEGVYREELPGWCVMEIDTNDEPTKRSVGGLHESIFEDEFMRQP